jgi:hypothetical protein
MEVNLKKAFILILLIQSFFLFSQIVDETSTFEDLIDQVEHINDKNTSLQKDIDLLTAQIEKNENMYSIMYTHTNDNLSNLLQMFSLRFTISAIIVTIVVTIIGIIVGAYINGLSRKIKQDYERVKKIQCEVIELDNDVKHAIYNIYEKLRRQETIYLLNNLIKNPDQIHENYGLLIARELKDEDYHRLKDAYHNYILNGQEELGPYLGLSREGKYLHLFYENYLDEALSDIDFEDFFETLVEKLISKLAFSSEEIQKVIPIFIKEIINKKLYKKTDFINDFVIKLSSIGNESNFKIIPELLFKAIEVKNLQFTFYEKISTEGGRIKENMGKLLIVNYKDKKNTKRQDAILDSIS